MDEAEFCIDADLRLEPLHVGLTVPLYALIRQQADFLVTWVPTVASQQTPAHTRAYLSAMARQAVEGRSRMFALVYRDELVGICGLVSLNPVLGRGRLAYWLAESYQGLGIVTRACRWLMAYGQTHWHLWQYEAAVAEGNQRSQSVCHQLGLTCLRRVRHAEQLASGWVDHLIFGLNLTLTMHDEPASDHSSKGK